MISFYANTLVRDAEHERRKRLQAREAFFSEGGEAD
jgi:hypothetical protein